MQVPIHKLDRKHQEYDQYSIPWENISLLSEGGVRLQQHVERFLIKRPRELFDVFQERIKRVTYTNIIGTVIGWYGAELFKRYPEIDSHKADSGSGLPVTSEYTDFLNNCDRQGTKFVDLFRQVFDALMLYGRSWVMVDAPHADQQPTSLLDEREMGLDQPYCLVYDPRQIINWAVDDFGNLEWVLTKSLRQDNDFLGDAKPKLVWCLYDRQKYQRFEADADENRGLETGVDRLPPQTSTMAELVDEGSHALSPYGLCPFRQIQTRRALWLANRVYLQLVSHFNLENGLEWALNQGNLAMPVIFSDSEPQFTLSEASYVKMDREDKIEWLEPTGRSFGTSTQRIDAVREEIYRSCYLLTQGRSTAATAAASSGFAKQIEMLPSATVANEYGDLMRAAMESTLGMVALARQDKATQFYVRGFRFETKPATETVSLADEVSALMIPSPTLRREMQKRVVRDVLEDSGEDVLNKACHEIDAAPEPEQQQADAAAQMFQQTFQKMNDRQEAKQEIDATA